MRKSRNRPRPVRASHQVVQQHPAVRVEDIGAVVLRRVGFVDGLHHLVGDARKRLFRAVVVVDHARGRRCVDFDDVIAVLAVAQRFRQVVVERQVGARHIGQIGRDVVRPDVDLAVLHVLGVHELDLVDQAHFVQQHGANEAVEVAAGDETVLLGAHGWLPLQGSESGHAAAHVAARACMHPWNYGRRWPN